MVVGIVLENARVYTSYEDDNGVTVAEASVTGTEYVTEVISGFFRCKNCLDGVRGNNCIGLFVWEWGKGCNPDDGNNGN